MRQVPVFETTLIGLVGDGRAARHFHHYFNLLGLPPSAAHPYPARMAANIRSDARRSVTGSLIRGGTATIAANLHQLEGDPFQAVHAAFVRAYAQRS